MSLSMLKTLYAQKTWSNAELYDCIATVDAAQHAVPLHTALRTLNHIYVVDRIFRAHLLGEPHGYAQTNTVETPPLGELHRQPAQPRKGLKTGFCGPSPGSSSRRCAPRCAPQFVHGRDREAHDKFGTRIRRDGNRAHATPTFASACM